MDEALHDHAFAVHSYKHTTIGFVRDIEDMPHQFAYSRQFFDRYYRPDNVILLVVGDVSSMKFSSWSKRRTARGARARRGRRFRSSHRRRTNSA